MCKGAGYDTGKALKVSFKVVETLLKRAVAIHGETAKIKGCETPEGRESNPATHSQEGTTVTVEFPPDRVIGAC
jgi:hypothetical protein